MGNFIDLPLKMEPIQCSETSAISTQKPGKQPKENLLHLTHVCLLLCLVSYKTLPQSDINTGNKRLYVGSGTPDDERLIFETCRVNVWIENKIYHKLHLLVYLLIIFIKQSDIRGMALKYIRNYFSNISPWLYLLVLEIITFIIISSFVSFCVDIPEYGLSTGRNM
jgi:hypothetical protein